MIVNQHDWLESLALRSVGVRSSSLPRMQRTPQHGAPSERFSRATAVKLALAGLASLAFGTARVSPARGAARDECLNACYRKHVDAADRGIRVCADIYSDRKSFFNTPVGTWARWRHIIKRGGWNFIGDVARRSLWEACESLAIRRMEKGMERCEDACAETCPNAGDRSPSGLSAAPSCRGTDPPPPHTPALPPPPGIPTGVPPSGEDACLNCMSVGGVCCPTSVDPFFLCTNAFIGCP